MNELFNDQIKQALNIPNLRTQGDTPDTDMVYCRFYDPADGWEWYVLEAEAKEDGDYFFHALIKGTTTELAYYLLSNLTAVTATPPLIRDIDFQPMTLGKVKQLL